MSRSLLKKLGIKPNDRIQLINAPETYPDLLGESLPEGVAFTDNKLNFIHFFTNEIQDLEHRLPLLQNKIVSNGMIWVSWYKKSSKKPSELTEDIVRDTALALKLVDVKVCSVNEHWSALKLVIRKALRH